MNNCENLLKEIKKEIEFNDKLNVVFTKSKSDNILKVLRKDESFVVEYSRLSDIARAYLIIKANEGEEDFLIEETVNFKDICLMVDCSRNAVKNVETVKKLIRIIAMAGYTSLMLYTEDTYQVDDEPMFGYLRGGYSKEEIVSLSNYANFFGIELIPCIQTLAHLNQLKRYHNSHFNCFDCSDILFVGNDRTYELIENCFKTISKCFSSKKVHIGMDEAWLLGRGKFADKNGCQPTFEIMLSHLSKVCEIAKKYELTPIMWSDMFWRIACSTKENIDKNGKVIIPSNILTKIPEDLVLCHWDYHNLVPEGYYEKLDIHEQFVNAIWFAGGTAMSNRGFVPHITYSMRVAEAAIKAAKNYNIETIVETVWGDNGGECSLFASLPSLIHYVYTARDISKKRLLKEFKALTGYQFYDFINIEQAQTFCGKNTDEIANPAKYGLYNDIFLGYVDAVINVEDKAYFQKAKQDIKHLAEGKYGYLFKTVCSLCDVLSIKYDIGVRLRKAYVNGDKNTLYNCYEDISKIITFLEKFIDDYRKQWLIENKPHGLEIQEIRLGGLKERLVGCNKRLFDYLEGKINSLPELAENLNPQAISRMKNFGRCDLFSYQAIASVNSFDGFIDIDV